jgi:hypothetical protein
MVGSGVVGQRAIQLESKNLVGYFKSDLTIAEQLSVADLEGGPDQSLANSTANVGSC